MTVYERPLRKKADDMRLDGEKFCADCPDHEACMTAWPCWRVREVHNEWARSKGQPDEMVESGDLTLATPVPYKGWKVAVENWALAWNFPKIARFMRRWDERGLGR